jgi:hypothetical protein
MAGHQGRSKGGVWKIHSPKFFKKQSDKSGNIIKVARKSMRLP